MLISLLLLLAQAYFAEIIC